MTGPEWARDAQWWRVEFVCTGDSSRPHRRTVLGHVDRLCNTDFVGQVWPDHGTYAAPRVRGMLYVWPDAAMTTPADHDWSPEWWAGYEVLRTWTFKCFRCTGRNGGERTLVLKDPQLRALMDQLTDARERVFDLGAARW